MNRQLAEWAREFADEFQLVVGEHIHSEARGNMHSFSFSDETRKALAPDDVCAFVLACADAAQRHPLSEPYVFYAWYDEQADQLRMSAVGQRFERLPFRRALSEATLDVVASHFLGRLDVPLEHSLPVWKTLLRPSYLVR